MAPDGWQSWPVAAESSASESGTPRVRPDSARIRGLHAPGQITMGRPCCGSIGLLEGSCISRESENGRAAPLGELQEGRLASTTPEKSRTRGMGPKIPRSITTASPWLAREPLPTSWRQVSEHSCAGVRAGQAAACSGIAPTQTATRDSHSQLAPDATTAGKGRLQRPVA